MYNKAHQLTIKTLINFIQHYVLEVYIQRVDFIQKNFVQAKIYIKCK